MQRSRFLISCGPLKSFLEFLAIAKGDRNKKKDKGRRLKDKGQRIKEKAKKQWTVSRGSCYYLDRLSSRVRDGDAGN